MSEWLFPLFVLAVAGGLIVWHVRAWRQARRQDLPPAETEFHWRQCRRRIQTSAMLAVLAVGLLARPWIEPPLAQVLLGLAVFVLVLWIGLLAVADLILTRHHYERLRSDCIVEQAKLQIEARRLRGLGGNGQPEDNPQGPRERPPD